MEAYIRYILISTICLSICYLSYIVFLRKEPRLLHLRYFLLGSMLLSIIMPLSNYKIQIDLPAREYNISEAPPQQPVETVNNPGKTITGQTNMVSSDEKGWDLKNILLLIYFTGVSIFVLRLLFHLLIILQLFFGSIKAHQDNITILSSKKIKIPFSFFKWVFVPQNMPKDNENGCILNHERIHASQYHSIDLILVELLSAVMWFNPLIWIMRKTVQLVHEYLADEGVLNTGIDKLQYQALLINQVAEERLICLSSSFNHSLIKKRITMMTKSKLNQRSKLRILALIPLATIIFFAVACVNGQNKSDMVTAVEPVRMNVLYVGVDNPVKIAASGYDAADLSASVDNGTISGKNGEYVIRPEKPGLTNVTVTSNGKEIQQTSFRAKMVPDPVATIKCNTGFKKNGVISKQELLDAKKIMVLIENFDFDMNFEVVSYVMSATDPKTMKERVEKTNSGNFSSQQLDLINSLTNNQKLIIEEIVIKGPDGATRYLSPMVLTING